MVRKYTQGGKEISPLGKPECQALLDELASCATTENDRKWLGNFAGYFLINGHLTTSQVETIKRVVRERGGDADVAAYVKVPDEAAQEVVDKVMEGVTQVAVEAVDVEPNRPRNDKHPPGYWTRRRILAQLRNGGYASMTAVKRVNYRLSIATYHLLRKDPTARNAVEKVFADNRRVLGLPDNSPSTALGKLAVSALSDADLVFKKPEPSFFKRMVSWLRG